jgi:hypothetical protein
MDVTFRLKTKDYLDHFSLQPDYVSSHEFEKRASKLRDALFSGGLAG